MYKGGTVYILTNPDKTSLYVGVTSDLVKRMWEHKNKQYPGSFTSQYNCTILVYYNRYDGIEEAIVAEKKLKAGNRKRKEALINAMNPDWKDLTDSLEY